MQKTEFIVELMRSDKDDVDGRDVMQAIEYIKEIDKYICWVPTRMEEMETWWLFLRGLAEAERHSEAHCRLRGKECRDGC